MAETRKLAAILIADVVGFSRLTESDEEGTLAHLRGLRRELFDPAIATHGGRVVKRTGDGAIVEFRSVVEAVRCALDVLKGLAEDTVAAPSTPQIQIRIGVHLGDVIEESDGDLMGDGVNIAARLESICEPGEVCLSGAAYEQVRDRLKGTFVDLGERSLKNLSRSVRVFSLRPGATAPDRFAPTQTSSSPRLSIVVLPFVNIGGGAEQDYFVDGVTESLTTDLSRISGAFVIGRNTAFTYRGKAVDLRQVGRDLNVRYVLQGSVQRSGDHIRVNVQLVAAATGAQLWTERFDKLVADLFAMQDEIVARLANQLRAQLVVGEARRAERAFPPEASA